MADETKQVITNEQPSTPAATPKAEEIAAALITALENRQQRAERSVTRSFSEQYGLSEDEVSSILARAKADKEAKIPETAQKKIDEQRNKVNKLLISAELKAKGAAMGLVDAETAMLLVDMSKIAVDDTGTVSGLDTELNSLKEKKPFLFAAQPTGVKTDVGGRIYNTQQAADGVEAAFLRKNPDIKI